MKDSENEAQDQIDTMRIKWDCRVKMLARMEREGGSFVKALANAARHADEFNYQKLATAFSDYWEKYSAEI